MRRLPTFICGVVVGALLLYSALNYHLIRAKDGMHLVPKLEASLASTYVDIRSFGPVDWLDHLEIAEAIRVSGRGDLLEDFAADSLRVGLDRLLPPPAER